jgi:thiamine-monophosphate kinase
VQLKKVGEFGLIDAISNLTAATHPSVIKGIGDDAAVFKADTKSCFLATTDTLNEGIHFNKDYTSPYLLGKKCLSVNLSDIAAMGGTPLYYLVSISVSSYDSFEFIRSLYKGMEKQAKRFNTCILGGDTTSSRDGISITITLLGKIQRDRVVYRNGAKKGDLVFVTGTVGDSALGFLMLKNNTYSSNTNSLIMKHIDPAPRVSTGLEISRLKIATSMIDISDGLIADLRHILRQSCAGALISLPSLPLSRMYKKHCFDFSDNFYKPALCGGEDYELLFTANPQNKKKVEKLAKQEKIPITCIGEITGDPSELLILDENGRRITMEKEGFTHF